MAAGLTVSRTRYRVQLPGQPTIVDELTRNWATTDNSTTTPNPGANGVVGTTIAEGGHSVTISRSPSRAADPTPYREFQRDQQNFELFIEYRYKVGQNQWVTTQSFRYIGCFVSSISASHGEDGTLAEEVTLSAEHMEFEDKRLV